LESSQDNKLVNAVVLKLRNMDDGEVLFLCKITDRKISARNMVEFEDLSNYFDCIGFSDISYVHFDGVVKKRDFLIKEVFMAEVDCPSFYQLLIDSEESFESIINENLHFQVEEETIKIK
jgi:hypothetical protein